MSAVSDMFLVYGFWVFVFLIILMGQIISNVNESVEWMVGIAMVFVALGYNSLISVASMNMWGVIFLAFFGVYHFLSGL